jgi:hypothetical protein
MKASDTAISDFLKNLRAKGHTLTTYQKTKIAPSTAKAIGTRPLGQGVVLTGDARRGELLTLYQLLKTQPAKSSPRPKSKYVLKVGNRFAHYGEPNWEACLYGHGSIINHAPSPTANVCFVSLGDNSRNCDPFKKDRQGATNGYTQHVAVALRDLKANTELLVDYGDEYDWT